MKQSALLVLFFLLSGCFGSSAPPAGERGALVPGLSLLPFTSNATGNLGWRFSFEDSPGDCRLAVRLSLGRSVGLQGFAVLDQGGEESQRVAAINGAVVTVNLNGQRQDVAGGPTGFVVQPEFVVHRAGPFNLTVAGQDFEVSEVDDDPATVALNSSCALPNPVIRRAQAGRFLTLSDLAGGLSVAGLPGSSAAVGRLIDEDVRGNVTTIVDVQTATGAVQVQTGGSLGQRSWLVQPQEFLHLELFDPGGPRTLDVQAAANAELWVYQGQFA